MSNNAYSAKPHLYIAIPAMDELDFLPHCLTSIAAQETDFPFSVYICVNQPDNWWEQEDKLAICERNATLISFLNHYSSFPIHLIDKSSKGNGWKGKHFGVGFARKVIFDTIFEIADKNDIIISLDADTQFDTGYFQSIGIFFNRHMTHHVMANPYYHPLKTVTDSIIKLPDNLVITGNSENDKAILRYELYLRNWHINLAKIRSPYAFTALGSAIAVRVWALQKIGGITPLKSGEDFYLLQKLRKMGDICQWNNEIVFPAARFSDRVFFGTGPAMIKGIKEGWSSYPIFHHSLFQEILDSYNAIEQLFQEDMNLPFLQFLKEQFKEEDIWSPIRKNAKNLTRFTQAFHEKADGLRIFQYIRNQHKHNAMRDEDALRENLQSWLQTPLPDFLLENFSFEELSVTQLNMLRELLFIIELGYRKISFF